ncbi:MAG: aminotransferase class IV family protein [Rhizobiaceae bacterium]
MPAQGTLRIGLIETLRWEPVAGFIRLERHLSRLVDSAAALGLSCDVGFARRELDAAGRGDGPLRVRLELDADGLVKVEAKPFAPLPAGTVWRLRVATAVRLDSTDPLLRHKTTRRTAYETARAEFPAADADEVLLLNERGEVCEGAITTVFADLGDGQLVSPPLSSGLLAGVLRAEMLESGQAVERVLAPADLRAARALFAGNSLRELISARLAD